MNIWNKIVHNLFDITEIANKKEKRWQRLGRGVRKSCDYTRATNKTTLGSRKQSVSNTIYVL